MTLVAMASPLLAGPVGEQVVAGQATVTRPDGQQTLIQQGSQKAVINWQSFDVGAAEAVRFAQPSSSSVALNRVVGQSPTEILGVLTANGQIFLLNPNGVLFSDSAQVSVGGLVATTLQLSDEDFLAGRVQLVNGGTAGEVRNAGQISADGGYVVLAAPQVGNDGRITASDVALAAGDKINLQLDGSRLVSVRIDAGALNAVVQNRGLIRADGGQVLLTAKAADQLIKSVVNNSGVIEAATLSNVGGRIRLEGDEVISSGTLSARGEGGQRGGSVEMLGNRVALLDGATVDVSGDGGGGTALVGGDYQGKNNEIRNAERTHVSSTTSINADARDRGDGGKVIVWADGDTRYLGSISARGGDNGGDGGFVEVSGKEQLDMLGRIDVGAAQGSGGTVLLDPQDIVLNTSTQASPPTNANGTPDVAFATAPAAGTYTIQITDIVGYSELYLQATNNITVASALTMSGSNSVRFEAGNTIAIIAALTARGGVDLSAANVTSTAAGTITSSGAANTNAGNITINATNNVSLAGALAASGGTSSGTNVGRNGGTIAISGNTVALGAATLTASGSNGSGAAQTGGSGGTINITATNGITGTGAITASGGNGGTGVAAGGAAGTVAINNSGAGNISVGALSVRTGNAVTSGASGAVGSIAVTNSATGGSLTTGALATTGGNGGHGGTINISSAGNLTTGTIGSGGGTANTGTAGRNAGSVTLTSAGSLTAGAITASGSPGLGTSRSGGNGANVQISSDGAITTGAINAAGGAGITSLANGGSAGSISVTNNSATTGAIALGALNSNSGAAFGTGTGGTAGAIQVTNNAAGQNLNTGAINASGGTNSSGANVTLASLGDVTVAGLINVNGAVRGTGVTGAGTNAGAVTISGVNRSVTGAITASGAAGLGINQAGGNAGTVSITGSGTLTTAAITASTGAATGTGTGGTAGGVTLTGTSIATGALATNGAANGHGGAVSINASGNLTTGTIATGGGTALAGNSGRNAGDITLNAGGVVTGVGAITASGSAGVLTGDRSGGNGATVLISGVGGVTTGAITASGGAAAGTNAAGGNAGSISVANSGSGNLITGALTAQTGNAVGTGAGGTAGSISVANSAAGGNLTTAGINSSGGTKGHGGSIDLSALGALSTTSNLTAAGGTTVTGNAGRNAGTITLSGAGVSTGTGTITATGSAGLGTSQSGGSGANVSITSDGAITTGAISAAGGAGTTSLANGGNAGSISVTNTSSTTGAIALGALTSNSGAAFGAGTGGTAGAIQVTNNAAGQNLNTGAITASGGTNSSGAMVDLLAQGNVTVAGLINVNGGARGIGVTGAGTSAGAITISGVDRSVTGAITANGGAGSGTNQAGGNAGAVSITGTGTLTTVAITSSTGAATGTGASGAVGGITLAGSSVSSGALTTTGGANGNGGDVDVMSTAGNVSVGAIAAGGGAAISGNAGRNAGSVTLNSAGSLTATTITASGSAGVGASQSGGNGAAVQLSSDGAITTGNISAAGGAGITSLANGGSAGSISVTNNSTTAGAIALGSLSSNSGAAFGTGAGGTAGAVQVTNNAAGQNLATGAINASGGTNSSGANVTLASLGDVAVTGAINSNGGARGTGVTAAGTSAGAINISGVNRSVTGAITASGGAGLGTNQGGGNAGAVSITGSGTLSTAAITSSSGAALGTGAGGAVGGITLSGSSVSSGALITTGGANGIGGNVSVTSLLANLAVGAITTNGGAAVANNAGRNAGSVTLNSAGLLTATTISAIGSGGSGASRAGGNGGAVNITADGAITVAAITTSGGGAGTTGNANGGAGGSVVLDAGGATPNINLGGAVSTVGGIRRGTGIAGAGGSFWAKDATTNTLNVAVNTAGGAGGVGGNIRFDGALNEDATARTLTLTAGTGAIALAGGTPTNALTTFTATGASNTLGSITTPSLLITKGAQSYTGAVALNGALTTTGTAGVDTVTFNSPVTLTGNSSITTAGGSGDNITIAQTVNGNFNFLLDAGLLGNVTTSAVIGGIAPLNGFSVSGANVTLGRSVTANSIFARATSGDLTLNTAGTVLTGTGTGNAVELMADGASGRFINNVGAGVISASNNAGRFLIWSQTPSSDTRGGLVSNFKQYAAGYGVTAVADSNANNNGFLYTVEPVITVDLIGSTSKTYDGGIVAALTSGNYSFSGAIDGDSVSVSTPSNGSYADKHVGSGKAVTASGLAIDSASNGAVTVYGYTLASTSATANIGTISQRALTVTAAADSKSYDGGISSSAAPIHVALQSGDSANFTQSFDNRNVGASKTLTASGVVDDGNGGANYSYTFVTSNAGEITPALVTVTAQADNRSYDGTAASSIAPIVSGTLYDAVGTAATQQFDTRNAGSGKTLAASGLSINDGNGGNNYAISYVDSNNGVITPAALIVTAQADSRVYDGTFVSSMAPVVSGTLYDGVSAAATQQFVDRNAGSNKTLSASGLAINDGNGGNNYAISYVANNNGVITPAALTVAADSHTKIYGNADPLLGFSVDGLIGGDSVGQVFNGALSRTAGEDVAGGPYAINQGTLATNGNYAIAYAPGQLTITPRSLTISADNKAMFASTSLPMFTASYEGFAFNDDPSSLSGALLLASTANAASAPGVYAITPSGQSSSNYAISYVDGALLVIAGGTRAIDNVLSAIYAGADWMPLIADVEPEAVDQGAVVGCSAIGTTMNCSSTVYGDGSTRLTIINDGVKVPVGLAL